MCYRLMIDIWGEVIITVTYHACSLAAVVSVGSRFKLPYNYAHLGSVASAHNVSGRGGPHLLICYVFIFTLSLVQCRHFVFCGLGPPIAIGLWRWGFSLFFILYA